jgi:hypothetical protein
MEEDRETRTDEDVEAHLLKNQAKAQAKARNDEGDDDDVEAHLLKNQVKNQTKA